jgi:hypothetical protein
MAPCSVCGGDHKCSRGADGLILCGRRSGPQPGFVYLGPCEKDPTWHLYRHQGEQALARPRPTAPTAARTDWEERLGLFVKQLGSESAAELGRLLGLPEHVFALLPVGHDATGPEGPIWFFPERDAAGAIIGLQRRYRNGEKRNLGQRGLCIPEGWQQRPGPVFLPEGASDTLALTALGLAAVGRPSNCGGVSALASLLQAVPGDRTLMVVGDNDERANGAWPGRQGAMRTALQLTGLLGRQVQWTLPPSTDRDVRAWVAARRMDPTCADEWSLAGEELANLLVKSACSAGSIGLFDAPPTPLERSPAVPAFPVELLPTTLADYVRELADALACPVDFVGVPMLALAGAALGNAWRLAVTDSHMQSAALFAAVVGVPGSAKSPALAEIGAPLHEANSDWLREAEKLRETNRLVGIELEVTPRRCLVDDYTTEGLAPILQANPKGVAVVKDELAGLIHSLNQYKGGRGHDRQVLLSMWAGFAVVVDRKGAAGPVDISNPFVAIVGGIQPAVLDTLRTSRGSCVVDDGLLDRFLFAYPEQPPVVPERWRVLSERSRLSWQHAVTRLLGLGTKEREFRVRMLPLSETGRREWEAFTIEHAKEANELDPLCGLQGVWSKMRGYAARLALIVQALRWACGEARDREVDGESMRSGAELVRYFKAHARRVHCALESDQVLAGALTIHDWLAARPGVTQFTRAKLYQSLRRQFARPALLNEPLSILTELHYLVVVPGSYPLCWVVNDLWERSGRK